MAATAAAAAMPVFQLYGLSFCSGPEALVRCQQRIHLKAFSAAASSPTDVFSRSGRARRQHGLPGSLPRKSTLRYGSCGRWQGDTRCTSNLGMAAEGQNVETAVTKAKVAAELDERGVERRLVANACRCGLCGRRGLIAAVMGAFSASQSVKAAGALDAGNSEYKKIIETVHPSRGGWYEEFFARVMNSSMDLYEAGVGDYKRELFGKLDDSVEQVLELGIGTGPNLKYYGNKSGIQKVIGVDPNLQMAKFCSSAALNAGLSQSQFEFIHGVGEIIPLPDASVDAVVCTLVLCSVNNVSSTLKEVKRVLKPGGAFLFVEHVAAPEGNGLRLWQRILDPLQQLFADGCHLTRDTLGEIESAQFESVEANNFTVPGLFVIGPHISGVAHTAHKDLHDMMLGFRVQTHLKVTSQVICGLDCTCPSCIRHFHCHGLANISGTGCLAVRPGLSFQVTGADIAFWWGIPHHPKRLVYEKCSAVLDSVVYIIDKHFNITPTFPATVADYFTPTM